MATFTLKNLTSAPLAVRLTKNGEGKVLQPQGTVDVTKLLPEHTNAVNRGDLSVTTVQDADVAGMKDSRGGSYSAIAGDATANQKVIATGLTSIDSAIVQVIRAGKVVTADAAISWTGGNLTVADGTTFDLAANDKINWVAVGDA